MTAAVPVAPHSLNQETTFLRQELNLSRSWDFIRMESENMDFGIPLKAVAGWETVDLPHTPRIEPASVQFPFQGIVWYRRCISSRPEWCGKRIRLEFGAGMQIADVWVNDRLRFRHLGGYLPFGVDLTHELGAGESVELYVRLDNRDTDLCPPGKPIGEMDFSYFGGLYREAKLTITETLHVSDPVEAGIEAGGGVFIQTQGSSEKSATIRIQTHVANSSKEICRRCVVVSEILDDQGELVIQSQSYPVMINAQAGHHFEQSITFDSPRLWHPDHPALYNLVSRVYRDGNLADTVVTRFGVRTLRLENRLYINGQEVRILGTNRHQEHPLIGNAVPPNAQRRDAVRIKAAGFNFVRLSHYPQDPSFLEACDELGLLVQAAVPGWQQFWMNPSFVGQSFQDLRDLIRRDRNHASIVFWEPNLNETGVGEDGEGHSDWCRAVHEIAHREYPGDQCFTFGDDYPVKPGWDWDVKGLWREYGDFAYGGNESTSRQSRGDGEAALLQQTWNFLWTLNQLSRKFEDLDRPYIGSATWVMFDYNRGYYHKPCLCGMSDMFRLPKYVHHFYRSQRSRRAGEFSGPMVYLATDWQAPEGRDKVIVFSNCDEVELRLNGRALGRQSPDRGPDSAYSDRSDTSFATVGTDYDRSGGNPFDGGNASYLPHPPFTFIGLTFESGELTAVGYVKGEAATEHVVRTSGDASQIALEVDLAGISTAKEGLDVLFVHARLLDASSTLAISEDRLVTFAVEGPAKIVGPITVKAEAGIASILVQSADAGGKDIVITASADGLTSGSYLLSC